MTDTLVDSWTGANSSGQHFVYRLMLCEDGTYSVEWRFPGEPDSAFRVSVCGDRHIAARKMGEILREMDERKNLLPMRSRAT